ncbi:uncharacterized protein LOC135470669 [Liolophura sinensis]|uniref:uncharacterized protein LOC135470669 n=1 Tax=Liolophura sinensis TaxID=3198878 RepID=UPI003158204B
MACREGRRNVMEVCSALFFICSSLVASIDGVVGTGHSLFKDFPISVLERHVKVSRHLPVCVIYRKDHLGSKLEETVYELWVSKRRALSNFSSWEVGAITIGKTASGRISVREVKVLPIFRCYLGTTAVHDYEGKPSRTGLTKWIQSLVNLQSKRLKEGTVSLINRAVQTGNNVLLGFTMTQYHELVEEVLYQIADKPSAYIEVFLVHHHSTDSRSLQEQYSIKNIPAIVYHGRTADGSVVKKAFSEHDLNVKRLELFLMAVSIPAVHITMANFEAEVLQVREDYVPIMICFYAAWANDSLSHLSTFKRTIGELRDAGVKMRYGILDVAVGKAAVSRWVRASFSVHVPFTLIFHLSESKVAQSSIVLSPSIPSPWRTYSRLIELGVNLTDCNGQSLKSVYLPWSLMGHHNQVSHVFEGPWGWMCTDNSHNLTDTVPYAQRQPSQRHDREEPNNVSPLHSSSTHIQYDSDRLESRLDTLHGIPVLTNYSWEDIILRSHAPHHPLYPGGVWKGEVTKISLVIYVMDGCGSCKNNMHTFSKLKNAISFIDGGSVYLVNCTADRELCKDHGVTGFPTLSAYRGLGWLGAGQCVGDQGLSREKYVRLDYHGVLLTQPIIDWFLSLTVETVDNKKFDFPSLPMMEDVRLVASLMPKMSRFLPIPPGRDYEYYLPYTCFRLACERLFGLAKCYSVYSQDIPLSEFASQDIQLIVAKVSLVRKDGVELTLMLLGKSLLATLVDQSEPRAQQYHRLHTHRAQEYPQVSTQDGVELTVMLLRKSLLATLVDQSEPRAQEYPQVSTQDGVELTLMLLGKSLLATLVDQSEPRAQQYHRLHTHRYDLKPALKCEDDHTRCTEFIVKVTRDHARLPVTQMTSTLFHTKNSLFADAGLPVLIAFVHQENITANSPFQRILTSVGYELYNEVITVTVDLGEFPGWVGQFVPLGYYSSDGMDKVNLFVYPRLCLIYWSDHHKAAFYPPLEGTDYTEAYQFTKEGIVDFAKAVVKSPNMFMVATEHF